MQKRQVLMVICTGFPATKHNQPRQIRKEAAVVVDSGAGGELVQIASLYKGY
jgi:hypothetical protein